MPRSETDWLPRSQTDWLPGSYNETLAFRVERERELTARVGRSKTDSLAADVNRSNSSATSMNTALQYSLRFMLVRILSYRKQRCR